MFTERTSVGLDVHARSVVAAAIDGLTGEVFKARLVPSSEVFKARLVPSSEVFKARLVPSSEVIIDWVGSLSGSCAV